MSSCVGSGYAVVREALYGGRCISVSGFIQQGVDRAQTCTCIEHMQLALQTTVYQVRERNYSFSVFLLSWNGLEKTGIVMIQYYFEKYYNIKVHVLE